MNRLILTIGLLLLLEAIAGAQQRGTYWIEQETTLSAGSEAVTVHMPSAAGRTARFTGATVYCNVACTFVIERDGSAPTATAITPVKTNTPEQPASTAVFRASNVGTAARILPKNYVAAGSTFTIGLEDNELQPGDNLTIRTNAISGTAKIMITWKEF